MNILFLDDSEARWKAFRSHVPSATFVFNAAQCIHQLGARQWDVVLLDHDLGGEEYADSSGANTGMEVVRWIEANKPTVKHFVVHSCNSGARANMTDRLHRAGYDVVSMPWTVGAERIAYFVEHSFGEGQG